MNTDTSTTDNLHLHVETKIPRIICISHAIATSTTIESVLKLQGYEVISCTHSLEALSLVFQLKPDLILCEITMSELDGYELCAMLRRSSLFRRTPIVMLTGKDQYIDRARARMAAATDYLTKPFADNELVMIVEKYLHLTSINFTKQKCVANT
jgi:twitching motility two-component system response regulator PilG